MPTIHCLLIDATWHLYRAFYGTPEIYRSKDGAQVNGVHTFCHMMIRLLEEQADHKKLGFTHCAAVFDPEHGSTYRKRLYPAYKANRPPIPLALKENLVLAEEACKAFNIPMLKEPGYEADDVIATVAEMVKKAGGYTTIVCADKDLFQLIDDQTRMMRGTDFQFTNARDIKRQYLGLGPEYMRDLYALLGDATDNVPGVHRIGLQTARQLLLKYGNIENIYANLEGVSILTYYQPKRLRQHLFRGKENAFLSKKLVTLIRDVPLKIKLEDLKVENRQCREVDERHRLAPSLPVKKFLMGMEFESLWHKIRSRPRGNPWPRGNRREEEPSPWIGKAIEGVSGWDPGPESEDEEQGFGHTESPD